MSHTNFTVTKGKTKGHLTQTERNLIEKWLSEGLSTSNIAKRLGRNRSTIYREIKRGTTIQIKQNKEVTLYFSDTGQANYQKNRKRSRSKGQESFSACFWYHLEKAYQKKELSGKTRIYNIKTFVLKYQRENPLEKVPCFKTVYRYIRQGRLFIKPHDLPVMYRLLPRKNKQSLPKGTNKKKHGTSISKRDIKVLERKEFGHWEADLVIGKKTKDEPAILTLLERKTRFGIAVKIANTKSDTVLHALEEIVHPVPSLFKSITFDNGSEFARAAQLETEKLSVYFCHAYSSWERGSNENFNKLLREFIPKGTSINKFTADDIKDAAWKINQRFREILDLISAEMAFKFEIAH